MTRYDARISPNSVEWLGLDEDQRVVLVEKYHLRIRQIAPNPRVHAVMHVIVENQLVSPDCGEVKSALSRLVSEGLTRHEAVHAIGSILAKQVYALLKGTRQSAFDRAAYDTALRNITAESWRREG